MTVPAADRQRGSTAAVPRRSTDTGSAPAVRLIQRRMTMGFSVELIVEALADALRRQDVPARVWVCPWVSRGVWPRIGNALAARLSHRGLDHIMGDVQYLALVLPSRETVLTILDVGHHPRRGWRREVYERVWYRWPLRRAGIVTAISEATEADILRDHPGAVRDLRVVPVCVHPSFVAAPQSDWPEQPEMLFVGNTANKNLLRFLTAIRGLPVRLHAIGHYSPLQRAAMERAGIPFRISAYLSTADVVRAYVDADLVAFPSTFEGFGLPIVEAQTVGRPVLTSDVGSMPDVAGDGALFVDPFSVSSIREGIERILADAELRRKLVAAGAVNAQRFSVATVAAQYARVYHDLARAS